MSAPDFTRIAGNVSKIDAARHAEASPAVRLVRGDTVSLEPVGWAWPGFLPRGMLTILGGSPGCGKTTIAQSLAATLTRAGTWPDGTRCTASGDVLIWSGEDAHPIIAARLKAAGADMQRVHFVDGISGGDGDGCFDPGRDMQLLEDAAKRLPNLQLLILDPIVSAVTGDSHKNAEVRRALQPVVALAQRTGCAVLGITHFSKGTTGRDPTERITGSLAFAALARLVLVAAKVKPDGNEESRRVLVRAKSNIGPDDGGFAYALERVEVAPDVEGQRVRWLEALEGSAREVLDDAEAELDAEADDAADVDGFLRGVLADGPMSARAIKAEADDAGYAWRTVQRAANRIGAERRKDGMKGGWVWALNAAPKVPRAREGAKDASLQSVSPSASSMPVVAPSDDAEAV